MTVGSILFFTLVVAAVTATPEWRIVGGQEAALGEFPYVASLQKNGKHICGCSIISPKFVLTAAACVYDDANHFLDFEIRYGVVNIYRSSRGRVVPKRIIVKENFEPGKGYFNDVALIELAEEIEFGPYVQPIHLAESYDNPGDDANATLVGWGRTSTNSKGSSALLKVTIVLFTHSYCQSKEPIWYSPENHVCAGVPEGGRGMCIGDAGGPLLVNGIQYGVGSWSVKPCASAEHPGVFASVKSYREWIRKHSGV